jgi:cytosine/adenosine deaminase-related metal-dependent hydrolase
MSSLLIRNATLPDGRTGLDLLCADGRIANLAPRISASAERTIDAGGMLVAPPFVDAHFHMDSTLTYGMPRVNASGTLLEGIALWGELNPTLVQDASSSARSPTATGRSAGGCSRSARTSTRPTRGSSPSRRCCTCANA